MTHPNAAPASNPNHDLYDHLGVPREADDASIRRAYRRKSKQTHPDAGGSPEEFNLTQTALLVLTDPKRRAEYDRTGRIEDAPLDNRAAAHAEIICTLFDHVCAVGAKNQLEPHQFDVLDGMRELCGNQLKGFSQQKRELENKLKAAESMGGRFRRKAKRASSTSNDPRGKSEGDNFLDRLMRGRCEPFRQALRQNAENIAKFEEVQAILAEYDFKFDDGPAMPTARTAFFFQARTV